MAMWGRMPLPPIPICPQEPWEAQEEAHRDRSRVKFSFYVSDLELNDPPRARVPSCAARPLYTLVLTQSIRWL